VYQPAMWGSCDRRTVGMFSEAVLVEPWDGVGEAATAKPIRHNRGLLGGCDAHNGGESIVGMLQAR
jgi:hypothetical protein